MMPLLIIAAYLIGAIPFGLLLTRAAGLGDIRAIGSGNIGATNVLRTGHKNLAAATLFLDGLKGAVVVLIARKFGHDAVLFAGVAALLGHLFPVWLGFRGGKGVATGLGILLAASWPLGVAACVTWLVVAGITRYSSLAAMITFLFSPALAAGFGHSSVIVLALLMAALVIWKHRGNFARLRAGTEPKIGKLSPIRSTGGR